MIKPVNYFSWCPGVHAEGHSGLGLAICKAIVDGAGGSIDATSEPGVGSTFTVRIPVN